MPSESLSHSVLNQVLYVQAILARLKAVEAEEATRDANTALLQLKAQEREKDRLADIAIEGFFSPSPLLIPGSRLWESGIPTGETGASKGDRGEKRSGE